MAFSRPQLRASLRRWRARAAHAKAMITRRKKELAAPVPSAARLLWHPGAERVVYADSGPFRRPDAPARIVWHTTEGSSLPTYSGTAPHFTLDPKTGQLWQHIPLNHCALALEHPSGTVETNHMHAIQIELVAFSDVAAARRSGHSDRAVPNLTNHDYAQIAKLARWIEANAGVARKCSVTFAPEGQNVRLAPGSWANYGGHCFMADSLILCRDKQRPISEVMPGMEVLSHGGKWCHVIANVKREVSETVILRGQGHPGIITTPEHPFLTYGTHTIRLKTAEHPSRPLRREFDEAEWRPASESLGRFWASPMTFPSAEVPDATMSNGHERPVKMTAELFRCVGRWLGDGSFGGNEKIRITGAAHEAADVTDEFAAAGYVSHQSSQRSTTVTCTASSTALVRWLREHFGEYSYGKHIPTWALGMDFELRRALLDGYLSADGHETPNGVCEANSVSKSLALGIKMLAQSLGYYTTFHYAPRLTGMQTFPDGRECAVRDRWVVKWRREFTWHRQAEQRDGLLLGRVRKAEVVEGVAEVFNLTVADDHSYVVDGLIVHNCGHQHVPAQTMGHWDPSVLAINKII